MAVLYVGRKMLRTESLEEITDGKKYSVNDMVKAGTGGCAGCSHCCETMADTIVLSPMDVFNLEKATGKSFEGLVDTCLELKIHDGIILPNMKSDNGVCVMLKDKRCTIHAERPDFCRLFPLGRLYEDDTFSYIMQINQCDKASVKVKVKKWIDTPDYERYSKYILRWHGIIKKSAAKAAQEPDRCKDIMMSLLQRFYQVSFVNDSDFYEEFDARADLFIKEVLGG